MTPELVIYSGNVLTQALAIRKGSDTASDELYESLKSCLEESSKELIKFSTVGAGQIKIGNTDFSNGNILEDRSSLKVSLKIFLYSLKSEQQINSLILKGLETTCVDYLDSVVLSFSGHRDGEEDSVVQLEKLQRAWRVLEESVERNEVRMIGMSNIETPLFTQLYTWAKIKPSILQINLASCCVVPPPLVTFCKENDVQLLTHSDPHDILSEEKLEELLEPYSDFLQSSEEGNEGKLKGSVESVVRFQIHLKSRGVLSTKGYIATISF